MYLEIFKSLEIKANPCEIFKKINLFLFIFFYLFLAVLDLHGCTGFPLVVEWGLFSSCGAQVLTFQGGGFPYCGALVFK